MSNWFRFYDDVVNDPKLIRLPDELYRAWVNLLCIAAKNDGVLPELADVALVLRVKEAKAAEIITKLVRAKLLDDENGIFVPHNWQGRQFKSDDSGERVKRHRAKKRNGTVTAECNVTSEPLRNAPEEKRETREENKADARAVSRSQNFRKAIVDAFAKANSPNLPETSRAELWLSQGFQEDICLAVIVDIVKRKPSITTLSYFDKPIADAHAGKAPPRQAVPMTAEEVNWDEVLATFKKIGHWSKWAGPDLSSPACRAPLEMLAKYDLVGAHEPIAIPPLRSVQ